MSLQKELPEHWPKPATFTQARFNMKCDCISYTVAKATEIIAHPASCYNPFQLLWVFHGKNRLSTKFATAGETAQEATTFSTPEFALCRHSHGGQRSNWVKSLGRSLRRSSEHLGLNGQLRLSDVNGAQIHRTL